MSGLGLELLDKLQKWICKTVVPSLATSFEPLAHRQNVAKLSLNWLNWFHFLILEGDLFVILIDCMTSATIPRWCKDVYDYSVFSPTARLWDSLPMECFPLTYDLNGFKYRINRHLLTVGFL